MGHFPHRVVSVIVNATQEAVVIGGVEVRPRSTRAGLNLPASFAEAGEPPGADEGDFGLIVSETGRELVPQPGLQWMRTLAPFIGERRLNQLFMTGAHDAGSYALSDQDAVEFAPDLPASTLTDVTQSLRKLLDAMPVFLFSFFGLLKTLSDSAKPVSVAWSRTQSGPIYQQLTAGARYFDIRLAYRPTAGALFAVHGFYGAAWSDMFDDIRRFHREAPQEIIVLEMRLVGQIPDSARAVLARQLGELPLLEPAAASLTVKEVWRRQQTVILSCGDDIVPGRVWHGGKWSPGVPWSDERAIVNTDSLWSLWLEELAKHFERGPNQLAAFGETLTTPDMIQHHIAEVRRRVLAFGTDGDPAEPWGKLGQGLRGMADSVNPWARSRLDALLGGRLNILCLDFCTDPQWLQELLERNGSDPHRFVFFRQKGDDLRQWLVLDASQGSGANQAILWERKAEGVDNQLWRLDGDGRIRCRWRELALQLEGEHDGAAVVLAPPSDHPGQRWRLQDGNIVSQRNGALLAPQSGQARQGDVLVGTLAPLDHPKRQELRWSMTLED